MKVPGSYVILVIPDGEQKRSKGFYRSNYFETPTAEAIPEPWEVGMERLMPLLNKKDFKGLKGTLQKLPLNKLQENWGRFKPFQKVILFKLLDERRAMEMYSDLPFEEKYLVLCAKQLQSLAPILEAFPRGERSLFHEIGEKQHGQMVQMAMREAPKKA